MRLGVEVWIRVKMTLSHSQECRQRIKACLEQTDEGRKRLKEVQDRQDWYLADEIERAEPPQGESAAASKAEEQAAAASMAGNEGSEHARPDPNEDEDEDMGDRQDDESPAAKAAATYSPEPPSQIGTPVAEDDDMAIGSVQSHSVSQITNRKDSVPVQAQIQESPTETSLCKDGKHQGDESVFVGSLQCRELEPINTVVHKSDTREKSTNTTEKSLSSLGILGAALEDTANPGGVMRQELSLKYTVPLECARL